MDEETIDNAPVIDDAQEGVINDEAETANTETVVPDAPESTDWDARVNEWGGQTVVEEAVALRNALQTQDGVRALAYQALNALGIGDSDIDGLFGSGEDVSEPENKDPERLLTAAEVDAMVAERLKEFENNNQALSAKATIVRTIDETFATAKVTDKNDKAAILAIADNSMAGRDVNSMSAEEVRTAINSAHASFTARVRAAAEDILKEKHDIASGLPRPLPKGHGGAGGEDLPEPRSIAEAAERVRQQMGIS